MPSNSKEYRRAYYKRRRKEVIEELGGKCDNCDAITDLEIDHKNGYNGKHSPNGSRGGERNLWDAIKLIKAGRKNELRLLCKPCNVKYQRWLEKWDHERACIRECNKGPKFLDRLYLDREGGEISE